MIISYCTNCSNRLWQLKLTIEHNLSFTKAGEFELCVLGYNDSTVEQYLRDNYIEYINDGRLKVKTHFDEYQPVDGSDYACGYVKALSHAMASGEILFNLDADNYINDAHDLLLNLKDDEVLKYHTLPLGSSGRIGVYRKVYDLVGGYRDKGRADDGDFIRRCLHHKCKLITKKCLMAPISNNKPKETI